MLDLVLVKIKESSFKQMYIFMITTLIGRNVGGICKIFMKKIKNHGIFIICDLDSS